MFTNGRKDYSTINYHYYYQLTTLTLRLKTKTTQRATPKAENQISNVTSNKMYREYNVTTN